MSTILAHAGEPLQPHDVWSAWNLDPILIVGLTATVIAYRLGSRPTVDTPARRAGFAGAMVAIVVALVSPLDAMAATLVSAHMVQHVLLILVAAPLLAVSAPGPALLRGTPGGVRAGARIARRAVGLDANRIRLLRAPVARWVLYVVTLWVWHASVVYGAAVENEAIHVLEHAMFLGTALLIWAVILGPARTRVPGGLALLAVFTLGLQGIFLSALLTFAGEPWYAEFLFPPDGWGLDPITDQQLAGLLMWFPGAIIHTGIALYLFVTWISPRDGVPPATGPPRAMAVPPRTR